MLSPDPERRGGPVWTDRRCVVVGGAGAVGSMFADLLRAAGASVEIVDPVIDGDAGDITRIGPRVAAAVARADLVLLAVAEPLALAAVGPVSRLMADGALLVDTLSVKVGIVAQARQVAVRQEFVSLNPMFAPSLGIAGRPIAAVVVSDGPRVTQLLSLVGDAGGRVVRLTADGHDRLTAASQAMTHAAVLAFGAALHRSGVGAADLAAVGPPPHTTMLALLSRIVGGQPHTYWDIQATNPYAAAARVNLSDELRRLADLVDTGDSKGFAGLLADCRSFLGPWLSHHQENCVQMFAAISGASHEAITNAVSDAEKETAP